MVKLFIIGLTLTIVLWAGINLASGVADVASQLNAQHEEMLQW